MSHSGNEFQHEFKHNFSQSVYPKKNFSLQFKIFFMQIKNIGANISKKSNFRIVFEPFFHQSSFRKYLYNRPGPPRPITGRITCCFIFDHHKRKSCFYLFPAPFRIHKFIMIKKIYFYYHSSSVIL